MERVSFGTGHRCDACRREWEEIDRRRGSRSWIAIVWNSLCELRHRPPPFWWWRYQQMRKRKRNQLRR
jgi:hypothetical protein